jgi:hypothetical protein
VDSILQIGIRGRSQPVSLCDLHRAAVLSVVLWEDWNMVLQDHNH